MTNLDPRDYYPLEEYDIAPHEGTERPHAEFTDWQARPSAGAWLDVIGVLAAVLIVAACFIAAVMGGWR